MDDKELYRKLGALTKSREAWKESIAYIESLLEGQSPRITAKALWLLGEMGLQYPDEAASCAEKIASFLDSPDDLLRERALNALGRTGRGDWRLVEPYWADLFRFARDREPNVRLSFIWASENIATNAAEAYEYRLPLFAELLHDNDDKVRMEVPEMFRVVGKRQPQLVKPYLDRLQWLAENDPHPVVRIHCAGAIQAIAKVLETSE